MPWRPGSRPENLKMLLTLPARFLALLLTILLYRIIPEFSMGMLRSPRCQGGYE
jgi:hypothetical protein